MKFSKSLSTVKYSLITLAIVLLPVAYYLFYYVPSKTDYFTHRNLRLLAEASTNFSIRIQGYQSWIDNTILKNDFIKTELRARYLERPAETFDDYNALFQGERLTRLVNDRLRQIENFSPTRVNFSIDSSRFERLQTKIAASKADSFTYTSSIIYKTPGTTNADRLGIEYYGNRIDYAHLFGNFNVHILATCDISHILTPLINKAIFDNVLLFENDAEGRVIYQMFKHEFLATRMDSIAPDLRRTFKSITAGDVKIGDMSYHLFVQPIHHL